MHLSSRNYSALRQKIQRAFPKGFLAEEAVHYLGDEHPHFAWQWSDETSQSGVDLVDAPRLTDELSQWLPLYELESRCAAGFKNEDARDLSPIVTELQEWCDRLLSPQGVFVPSPWDTYRFLPVLYRLRTACRDLGWTENVETAFQMVLGTAHRLKQADSWITRTDPPISKAFLKLLELLSSKKFGREWRAARSSRWGNKRSKSAPSPCVQSDEARIAVLRRDWSRKSTHLAVGYKSTVPFVDFWVMGDQILSGEWRVGLRVDGKECRVSNGWESTCWFEDDDGVYLEMEASLGKGVKLDRQYYLCRQTQMLWSSDTVRSTKRLPLELTWRMPLAADYSLRGEGLSRAQTLVGLDAQVKLIPAAMPANPLAPADGRLWIEDGNLCLTARAEATRLFVPLVWTWSRKPTKTQSRWRQLSVTNDRRRVESDEAVAFRVSAEDREVVFFRQLKPTERYAFVGQQTFNECIIAEFSDGDFDEWLIVE